jgi:large subunit ribosomal protein L29
MKNINEIRSMSADDLQSELLLLRKTQFNHRLKKASGSLDKPHLVKQVRRAIARVKTIMTEKSGVGI